MSDTMMPDTVTIPRAEYERLRKAAETLEDLEDLAAYDRCKAKLAAGEEELIRSEMVDRLLSGESHVKVWREYRGLSAENLALQAGVDPGELAEIENGRQEGAVATLRRIAEALGVTVDDLV